jgi:DNA-binding SARP family transcriptional activator
MSVADEDREVRTRDPGRHRFTPQSVGRLLGQLEARGARACDETLTSAVTTGRRALAEWQELAGRLGELEREYERLAHSESRALARLHDVLDLLDKLAEQPRSASAQARTGWPAPGEPTLPPRPRPGPDAAGVLAVRMLGAFELAIDGRRVTHWHGQRTQSLMQFLTAHRHRTVPRGELIAAVWPEADEDSGRHRLHQGVYELRSTLRAIGAARSPIVCTDGGYGVDRNVPVWVDVEEFDSLGSTAERGFAQRNEEAIELSWQALELYRGDFLCQATDADWATTERNRLRARFVLISIQLGRQLARRGDYGPALAVVDPVLSMEPWNEDATVIKMHCHAQTGARSVAAAAYRSCAEALTCEFGITPAAQTIRAYDQIRAGGPSRGGLTAARDRTPPRPPSPPVPDAARPSR